MAYGDRSHFDKWATDKHGRAKTPEFYVRSHEPDLSAEDAGKKAAALREKWGLGKTTAPKASKKAGTKKAAAKKSAGKRAPRKRAAGGSGGGGEAQVSRQTSSPVPSFSPAPAAAPARPLTPVEKASRAWSDAMGRKAAAESRIVEIMGELDRARSELTSCENDVRETAMVLQRLTAETLAKSSPGVVLAPAKGDGSDVSPEDMAAVAGAGESSGERVIDTSTSQAPVKGKRQGGKRKAG
jgi:hypothetical protein